MMEALVRDYGYRLQVTSYKLHVTGYMLQVTCSRNFKT
jgi:hypothetical protein